jgi:D-inositol-3-phosphate glycosyltransferase
MAGQNCGRAAVISLHSSPLAPPGIGDSGGMNVYVRELVAALAHRGWDCTVYVRRWAAHLPAEVDVEPGVRVVHIDAGPTELTKSELPLILDEFTAGTLAHMSANGLPDVIHANYWLSAEVGHRVKHAIDRPLASTFHTLARVKAEHGDPEPESRSEAEARIIGCSDVITASCVAEAHQLQRLYDAPPERIEYVAPGVDRAFFSPGHREAARAALGLPKGPIVLFVGRIQPLKGVELAICSFARLERPDATMVIVGGPSGPEGEAELQRITDLVAAEGLADQVRFVPAQPHFLLSSYYRAADVCVIPSRSESFGLVALEAAASGTPVVAAAVGGLRTLVDHGRTGFLVERRDPSVYASFIDEILDNDLMAVEMALDAAQRATGYSWPAAGAALDRVFSGLCRRNLVDCVS